MAPIDVELGGVKMILKAAVSTKLPQPVVIEWDAPAFLQRLLQLQNHHVDERVGIGPTNKPMTSLPEKERGV